jgi:hypothetical protein
MAKEPEKTLEMRVAELEDKLKGLQVTEEEMKAYNKVAAMMGGGAPSAAATGDQLALTPAPDSCVIAQCTIRVCTVLQCTVRACTIRACTIRACTIRQCCIIQDCINECGGGGFGGGFMGGGGFGSLGG